MIPAIRDRIDEANNAIDPIDIEPGKEERIKIPLSELMVLGEVRRREHIHRSRVELNSKLSEMAEVEAAAMASANEGETLDVQREYGLPLGQARQCLRDEDLGGCDKTGPGHLRGRAEGKITLEKFVEVEYRNRKNRTPPSRASPRGGTEARHDIWESIFRHVEDVDDVANLRDTCLLFRELLERKYKTMRFIQVALKFANKFGGFKGLLKLRQVCRSSKAAVDKLLSEEEMFFESRFDTLNPNLEKHYFSKPKAAFIPLEESLRDLQSFTELLQIDPNQFPIRAVSQHESNDVGVNTDPLVRNALRTQFQRFLEVAGPCVRYFEYFSAMSHLAAYDLLSSWITLMPQLEVLLVSAFEAPDNLGIPANLDLTPFPSCPKLKRYIQVSYHFCPPFVAQVFQANPGISDVFILYWPWMEKEEEAFGAVLGTVGTMQLERFKMINVMSTDPPLQLLGFRFGWPLKSLSLMSDAEDYRWGTEIPSRILFSFVNSFRMTLEELTINWKIRDTGGFLNLPKLYKLFWKIWPNCMTLEFLLPLENLQYLDVDTEGCREVNTSIENVKRVLNESNLPLSPMFPALRRIRARRKTLEKWFQIWELGSMKNSFV